MNLLVPLPEITRLNGHTDWIDVDSVERERTPGSVVKLGLPLHLTDLSLPNTIYIIYRLGVEYFRKAIHDWAQRTDLQPVRGKASNQVAVDETVIRTDDQQFWLYAAANPRTNELLHLRLFSTTAIGLTTLSQRTAGDSRYRILRGPRRWRQPSLNSTPTIRTPISDRTPRKSNSHRTYSSSGTTTNLFGFILFRQRRTGDRRKRGPEVRPLAHSAKEPRSVDAVIDRRFLPHAHVRCHVSRNGDRRVVE